MADTLRTSGRLSVAVLASRVLGVVREAVFALLFGAGFLADAYQVAFRIPNLLRDLFAEGALSSAFVPTFTAALVKEDELRANELGRLVASGVLVCTGLIAVLGVVFAEPIVMAMSSGFEGGDLTPEQAAHKLELSVTLTRVMMPFLCVVSLGAVFMGMLNARKRFMAPVLAPAMFNVVSILVGVALLIFEPADERGLWIWSAGTLGAGAVQALFQLPPLWRAGFRPVPMLRGFFKHPGVRRIARLMAPAVIGLAAIQVNVFFNTRFAGALGDGPVSQYSYAFRLFYLPVGVFSVALATVTTTKVSEEAAKGDMDALKAAAAEAMSAVWMLMVASTIGLAGLADPVIEVIFERGAFAHEDTLATARVLQAMVLALIPYGLVKILAPVFYGIDRPRIPLLASASAVAVNVTFNALTFRHLGAPGLALGMGLGMAVNFVILRVGLRRVLGPLERPGRSREALALTVAGLCLTLLVGAAAWGVGPVSASVSDAARFPALLVYLALVIGLGFALFSGVLRAFGYPGADALWQLPRTLAQKLRRR